MPVADKYDAFLMKTEDLRPNYVKIQRTIESALHIFEKATLHRRIEAIVQIKLVCLLGSANHEVDKG